MAIDADVDLGLRVITILAQVSVPVVIFYAGRKIARAQYVKSAQDAWNEFNKLVIHNEHNVRVGQKNFGFSWVRDSEDACRKAYIAFVGLNALVTVHYGTKHKLLQPDYHSQNV